MIRLMLSDEQWARISGLLPGKPTDIAFQKLKLTSPLCAAITWKMKEASMGAANVTKRL